MIPEEIVAKVHEFTLYVCAVYLLCRRPVDHELPDILAETAANVQQRLPSLHTLEYLRVQGMGAEVQAEEAELSDTWIREYLEGFVSL